MLKQKNCSSSPNSTNHQPMYPKVKVRALEQDDESDLLRSPLQGFNSLSIRDSSHSVKEIKQYPSVSVAKVPKSYMPRSITPPPSLPKSVKKSESEPDGIKSRIRASSIPRPRAVVSSPDNDQLLGSKNKLKLQWPSSALRKVDLSQSRQSEGRCAQTNGTLKRHEPTQSRQSEERCTRTSTNIKKPLRRGEYKETSLVDNVKAKKGSAVDVRVPITNITKAKPCFTIT